MSRRNPRTRRNLPLLLAPPNKQSVHAATPGVSSRVLVPPRQAHLSVDPQDPIALSDRASSSRERQDRGIATGATVGATLKPVLGTTSTLTSKRIGSLSASSVAGLASAACLAAWWLDCFDSRLSSSLPLVCGIAGGCYALFTDDNHKEQEHEQDQNEPEQEPMFTLTQFEHFGALRVDNYLRFLVTKLAVVWRAIAALHKTALNYQFTVSISDKPSLTDLQDLLEGRVPLLLTYDNVKPHRDHGDDDRKFSRSRVSSRASTAVTDDSCYYRESMDLAGLDLDLTRASFLESEEEKPALEDNEFPALEDQAGVTEYFTIDADGWSSDAESESSTEEDEIERPVTPAPCPAQSTSETKTPSLRSIFVPVLPVEQLAHDQNAHAQPNTQSSTKIPDPVVVPSVKPLIPDAKQADWRASPVVRREAAALLACAATTPAAPKRRISVNVTSMKPLPRLVVKARPSTLTPPQNVQRMLDQVERMMREVHDLLAAGRDVLRSVETPEEKEQARKCKKSVSFNDDVCVIDATLSSDLAAEEERELRSSLSYGPDEIESMSNEFFNELSLPSLE